MIDLIFFPALAADERLFSSLVEKVHKGNCRFPALPGFHDEETMVNYSMRALKQLDAYDISSSVLIGMSTGGQLAIEIAKQIQPRAIVLISSYRYSSRITSLFRLQFHMGRYLPYFFFKRGVSAAASYLNWRESLAPKESKILSEMASDVNPYQFVYGAKTASTWHHLQNDDPSCPILHIHGTKDWVIPFCKEDVTHPIENGRHLIQYTHSNECARIINDLIDR